MAGARRAVEKVPGRAVGMAVERALLKRPMRRGRTKGRTGVETKCPSHRTVRRLPTAGQLRNTSSRSCYIRMDRSTFTPQAHRTPTMVGRARLVARLDRRRALDSPSALACHCLVGEFTKRQLAWRRRLRTRRWAMPCLRKCAALRSPLNEAMSRPRAEWRRRPATAPMGPHLRHCIRRLPSPRPTPMCQRQAVRRPPIRRPRLCLLAPSG
mmetsp:Transcript_22536/g.72870  ORF Transcript_22536/g.72870 Transcript_22536/m.72870 type:complete len:211 (+) Transcript_22536:412-1044(+)